MSNTLDGALAAELKKSWAYLRDQTRTVVEQELRDASLDGLLALRLLSRLTNFKTPDVWCGLAKAAGAKVLADFQPAETPAAQLVLALPYLDGPNSTKATAQLETTIKTLMKKKYKPGEFGLLSSPRLLTALALGIKDMPAAQQADVRKWLADLCTAFLDANRTSPLHTLLGEFALTLLGVMNASQSLAKLELTIDSLDAKGRLLILWAFLNGWPGISPATRVYEKLLAAIGELNHAELGHFEQAILHGVTSELILRAPSMLLPTGTAEVATMLNEFPACLRREREPLTDEKGVQRIIWTILRARFPDLIDEQGLERYGLKQYKPDFGIPHLRLLIEAKFIRPGDNLKDRQDEVLADCKGYFGTTRDFDRLLVFIYDDSSRLHAHSEFVRDLKKDPQIADVIVIPRVAIGKPK